MLLCGRGWLLLASGHLLVIALLVSLMTAHDVGTSWLSFSVVAFTAAFALALKPPVRRWATRRLTGDLAR